MVALKGALITKFLEKPDLKMRAILVYGPDQGLVKERSDLLVKSFIGSLEDPFNHSRIDDSTLRDDVEKLRDEAHARSLMGGNRALQIHEAGDGLLKSIGIYLENPNDECLIVARAGDLKPSSKLRKFFESAKNAASLPCYSEDIRSLTNLIDTTCHSFNLKIEPEARQYLLTILGSDFAVSKSEIEKLCIYCMSEGNIAPKHVEAVCGDNGMMTLDTMTDSLLSGDLKMFDRAYQKASHSGQATSSIILSVSRHFQKLHTVSINVENGIQIGEAIKRLSPPLHFKRKDSFLKQAKLWSSRDILSALSDLQICEKETRQKPALSNIIAHRALLKMGYIARAKKQKNRF